jgi:hypothetical protein
MKVLARVGDRDIVDAVFDLAAVAVVLPLDPCGVVATLGRAGLIDASDGSGVGVFGGDYLLATITKFLFIPDDRFEKPLQGSRCDSLLQSDRFGVFSLHAGKQPANVNEQQQPTFGTSETVRETSEKLAEQFAQLCDIIDRHEAAFRGFVVKQITHGGSFHFCLAVNVNK